MADSVLHLSSLEYPPSPLTPILPWCRERLRSRTGSERESLLAGLPVPYSHRRLLLDYLNEDPKDHREVILPLEEDFEKNRLFRSTALLFFSLIRGSFSDVNIAIFGFCSHLTENFYTFLEETPLPPGTPAIRLNNVGEIIPWDGVSKLPPPQGKEGSEKDLLRRAMEFYIFGDNIQACRYFDLLYGKSRRGQLALQTEERTLLFRCYGLAALKLNQEDLALTVFNSLLNMAVLLKDARLIALAYGLTGEVYRQKGRLEQASHFFRKYLEPEDCGEELRFEGLFSLFLCAMEGHDTLTSSEKEELLELTVRLDRPKSRGIILLHTDPVHLDDVIELFTQRDNPILRAHALYSKGVFEWQNKGDRSKGERNLQEALKIGEEQRILYLHMKILHSLGQFYTEADEPEKAFRCYARALEGYLREERFIEIARIYISLAEMGFGLSHEGQARSFLRTARYILNRLPGAPELLKSKVSLLASPSLDGDGTAPEENTEWFTEPIRKDWVTMGLKQHVRYEHLKKGMYEINLLSDIQSILASTEERDRLILLTMERLLSSSLVNSLSFYERLGDSYRLAYHSSLLDEEPDRRELEDYLDNRDGNAGDLSAGPSGKLRLPVFYENIISGVIICSPESPRFSMRDEDKQVFTILAGQFSSALEKIRQKELILTKNRQLEAINRELTITTLTDPLTGIGNRIQLNDKIEDFTARYGGSRERDNFSLLFIDLDNFKYYNDTYGHPVGDMLLEDFSRLLKEACRESDWIFRYGGDEFVVLLAETDGNSSTLIADRILYELEKKEGYAELLDKLGYEDEIPRDCRLSCSIGISDIKNADGDGKRLLKQADTALYEAKESGKRQWKIYIKDGSYE